MKVCVNLLRFNLVATVVTYCDLFIYLHSSGRRVIDMTMTESGKLLFSTVVMATCQALRKPAVNKTTKSCQRVYNRLYGQHLTPKSHKLRTACVSGKVRYLVVRFYLILFYQAWARELRIGHVC